MAQNWRSGGLLAAGIGIGIVLGGWGMLQARKEAVWQPAAGTASMGNAPAPAAASAPGAAAPSRTAAVPPQRCDTTTVVPRGKEDGRESLQPTPSGATASEVASLILEGKEAVAAGRMRDAEIAFLNACRNAELVQATDPVPIADAMYQLGRHYTNTAQAGLGDRKEMMARASRLYGAALQTYRIRYGETGEKTKFALQGQALLQQVAGGKAVAAAPAPVPAPVAAPVATTVPAPAPAPVAKAPAPVVAPPPVAKAPVAPAPAPVAKAPVAPAPAPAPAVVAAPTPPAAPAPAPRQEARRTSPSFDCARAHSTTERLICGDEELARMDRDLGRLHARSKSAAADPRAFQRESDAQWAQREATCTDKECLRRWYAQRRQQLETQQAAAQPRAPAPVAERPARVTERPAPVAARDEPVARRPEPPVARSEPVARSTPQPLPRRAEPPPRAVEVPEAAMGANGAPTASGDAGDTGR